MSEKRKCGSCGRWMRTKINFWMQNRKHDMLYAELI